LWNFFEDSPYKIKVERELCKIEKGHWQACCCIYWYATYLKSSFRTKKCPEQNECKIDAIDVNSDVKPSRSFLGKSIAKSSSWYREVRIDRKKTRAVTEEQRAMSDEMVKMLNAGFPSKVGTPTPSLTPPGTVDDVANATVSISAATTEQDSEVLPNHSLPSLTRSLCVSVNISFGVWPFLLYLTKKCGGMESLTNYKSRIIELKNMLYPNSAKFVII
jgi:hypothetical protein